MHKFCVFCGNKPRQKNVEHVIPQWLIELTGNPKREAIVGPFWNDKKEQLETSRIPFDQFGFPACDECNNKFSNLEAEAKRIVEAFLQRLPLSANDFSTFLTWLDKVRIGIWLGAYYLHRKVSDIEPHMFIGDRIDKTDRLVFIYRSDSKIKRLTFLGTMTPAFQYLPSCFTLLVDNFAFFNAASDFLISKHLGLPYPRKVSWYEWPKLVFTLVPGKEHAALPLVRSKFDPHCTQIYQPMFARAATRSAGLDWYGTDYVKSIAADVTNGIGKVFMCKGQSLEEYPDQPSLSWEPTTMHDDSKLGRATAVQTLKLQVYLTNHGPNLSGLEPERREIVREQLRLARDFNRNLIQRLS